MDYFSFFASFRCLLCFVDFHVFWWPDFLVVWKSWMCLHVSLYSHISRDANDRYAQLSAVCYIFFDLIKYWTKICAQSFILANDKQEKNDLKMLQMKISPHMYEWGKVQQTGYNTEICITRVFLAHYGPLGDWLCTAIKHGHRFHYRDTEMCAISYCLGLFH